MDELFTALTEAMSGSFSLAVLAAAGWGMASILLSPCHLTSIPLVIGYIVKEGTVDLKGSFFFSFTFAFGILFTIGIVGLVTGLLGRMLGDVGVIGNILVALVFFAVGLYLLDVLKLPWDGVNMGSKSGSGWRGALMLGLVFGLGLGPCTFAYLAPVLAVALNAATVSPVQGALLIGAFGFGHCAVIVAAGSLSHFVQKYLVWAGKSNGLIYLKRAAGVLVLLGGFYSLYAAFA
ncbi:MAG: cytochrome c biogenesis protein CcdA [Bacteroidota bacterium]